MIYEICANSYESAKNAEAAGATRIELCSELGVGGITPSYGLIKKVMDELSIGNCVLIRPRSGDFTYSEEEFDVMLRDIVLCRELGCQGVVTGVLLHDNTIDVERTAKLKEAAGFSEVHFSGMVLGSTGIKLPFSFMTERFLDEEKRGVSDREIIRKIMGNG